LKTRRKQTRKGSSGKGQRPIVPGAAIIDPSPVVYDMLRPWTRQPCDDAGRWRAFVRYRDGAFPRSFGVTAAALALSVQAVSAWAHADAWEERCLAYDRHLDSLRCRAVEDVLVESAREVATRHAGILRDAAECAHSVVRTWLARLAAGDALEGWSPSDVRGMLRDMITLERLVRGEATERVEHGVGIDLSRLSIDEIETMRAIEIKAGVQDD
jgi:hypothetical protein